MKKVKFLGMWGPQRSGAQGKVPQLPPPLGGPVFHDRLLKYQLLNQDLKIACKNP